MAAKRGAARTGSGGTSAGSGPVFNAVLLGLALCYGLVLLVNRGRLNWPPNQLLSSLYTVAGCLAVVGPVVLARTVEGEAGLGELLWMTGGLLVWVFDAVAALRGQWQGTAWVTPLGTQTMGLTILAVLLAGWRCRVAGRNWSWTNVTGWILGLFWVGMALVVMTPGRPGGLALQ